MIRHFKQNGNYTEQSGTFRWMTDARWPLTERRSTSYAMPLKRTDRFLNPTSIAKIKHRISSKLGSDSSNWRELHQAMDSWVVSVWPGSRDHCKADGSSLNRAPFSLDLSWPGSVTLGVPRSIHIYRYRRSETVSKCGCNLLPVALDFLYLMTILDCYCCYVIASRMSKRQGNYLRIEPLNQTWQ